MEEQTPGRGDGRSRIVVALALVFAAVAVVHAVCALVDRTSWQWVVVVLAGGASAGLLRRAVRARRSTPAA
ncbi:hypothetical protein [Umezawaea beigongshangensis]|uniref:hypothetical protein n=1 Tax=Umezawaea beigongshangensis TaxID=2780383 RepID=UPI0018F1DAA3|nr:hypothetical protein [Umezawaea beigongshangensis]